MCLIVQKRCKLIVVITKALFTKQVSFMNFKFENVNYLKKCIVEK